MNWFTTTAKWKIALPFFIFSIIISSCSDKNIKTEAQEPSKSKLTSYVNPFIGSTGNGKRHSIGNTHPGAVLPWGMVAISPQSFDFTGMHNATGFRSEEKEIFGFSCVNLSGVGCPAGGSVPFKFLSKSFDTVPRGSKFSDQKASPGYYGVHLDDESIKVEVSSTVRSGIFKVQLPEGKNYIYLDLTAQQGHIKGGEIKEYTKTAVSGYQLEGYFCGSTNRGNAYFNVEMNTPADSLFLVYKNKTTEKFQENLDDKPSGIVYTFNNKDPKSIQIKVGVSYVSIENAKGNLDAEQDGFNFDLVRENAEKVWEKELSRVKVTSSSEEDKTVFYSALYRSLLMPFTFSDHNGEYLKHTNFFDEEKNNEVGVANGYTRYTAFSLWDTYRTVHPLFSLVYPERELDMVKTMVAIYEESGWLPKWEIFGSEPNLMVGDPASIVIGDTYVRGITDFDVETAYEAMEKQADQLENNRLRRGLEEYKELGYIPMDGKTSDFANFQWNNGVVWGPVSTTMEFNLSDYNVAQVAKGLGKEDDYNKFYDRSMSFMKLYDPELQLFRPKNTDGSWYEPFDPTQELYDQMNFGLRGGPGFVEGSAWQYLFSIPHGIDTLKAVMGDEVFLKQLNTMFEDEHFDMTNEPDLGYPFFYNYTKDSTYKTSKTVHKLLKQHFPNALNGLPGNDDAGTMSAWVVFAMMGIYPDTPGDPDYLVTTPMFEKVEISLNDKFYGGKTLTIERDGPVDGTIENIYLNDSIIGFKVDHKKLVEGNAVLKIKTTEAIE
ncbi:glycoside hydrolase family 92 protein [Galbibacter sp. BG1]|uniref:GH92 family glycosyl hydrolase n=1 Tax=Galbibacter sp. BG1 TaxID=1170699 RepID=UPI0015BD4A19|nr:GH92 family glycosyl hydrolase [Galbibacter sp. BG1]QLE02205.1 glycoside hydrolase family 92 protein [Galbibacter sp. BG1]